MSARALLILAAAAAIALAAALVMNNRAPDNGSGDDGNALVPGLEDQVNGIEAIDIVAPDGESAVGLRRERERWRVAERHGYEADFEQVRDLLLDLARGRRVEPRTARPEWYARLGVVTPGEPQADSPMIVFPENGDLPAVIMGHRDPAGVGRYVRQPDQERSWLADRDPEVPVDPRQWLETAIMDIPAAELAEVAIHHPDGPTVRMRAAETSGKSGRQWVLLDVPEGREAATAGEIRRPANALAGLDMEDVRPADGEPPADAVRAEFVTIDGLRFTAFAFAEEDGHWLRLSVQATAEAESEPDEERVVDATAADARLSPWDFRISQRRFGQMTPRLEDLLAETGE